MRALWLVVLLAGCQCGGDAAPVAVLASFDGAVTMAEASAPATFVPAVVGHAFVLDEAVRTAPAASAELELAGGGHLHVEPDTTIRFSRHEETPRVVVEEGNAVVEAAAAPIEFETAFGTARIEAGSRLRIGRDEDRFEILVGRARLERPEGERELVPAVEAPPVETVEATPPAPEVPEVPASERAVDVRGAAASVRAPDRDAFEVLPVGTARVAEGSVLRGGEGTTLDITTAHGHVLVAGDSEVRLVPGAVDLVSGTAHVEGTEGTRVEVPGGVLVLRSQASADVEVSEGGRGHIAVRTGSVTHETGGEARTLAAGEEVALGAPAPAEAPVTETGPEAAVSIAAGESAAIHDPRGRTAVRLSPPAGCGEGSWTFTGRRHPPNARSASPVVVTLPSGTFRYRVSCTAGARAEGSLRLDRDAGRASLPRTAPRTVVDTDGRSYSVLFQTLLPEIVVRWSRGAPAGPYELEVRRGSSSRRIASATASHTFASGEVPEGRTTFVFHAAGGAESPPTQVTVRFDNATPVATIRAPEPGAAVSGSVHLAGTVAEHARVSVGGAPITTDGAGRFDTNVPVSGDCLAIRVELAGRGTHYYLRCGGGP